MAQNTNRWTVEIHTSSHLIKNIYRIGHHFIGTNNFGPHFCIFTVLIISILSFPSQHDRAHPFNYGNMCKQNVGVRKRIGIKFQICLNLLAKQKLNQNIYCYRTVIWDIYYNCQQPLWTNVTGEKWNTQIQIRRIGSFHTTYIYSFYVFLSTKNENERQCFL